VDLKCKIQKGCFELVYHTCTALNYNNVQKRRILSSVNAFLWDDVLKTDLILFIFVLDSKLQPSNNDDEC